MGDGLLSASRADLRITSDDNRFSVPAVRLGLGYGFGEVKTLADLLGLAATRKILLTGKRFPMFDVARWGLVNRVTTRDNLESTAHELVATGTGNEPMTIRAIPRTIEKIPKEPAKRDLDEVDRLVQASSASEGYKEGRRAFREKRRPAFQDR